jgi:hypothetical protein
MDNPTKTRAIELAAEHEAKLERLLELIGINRRELTKLMAIDRTNVRPDVLIEVCYLDAYTKLINEQNYTPVDKADWRAVDYVEQLFNRVHNWAKDSDDLLEFHTEMETAAQVQTKPEEMYESILVAALMEDARKDDEGQRTEGPDPDSDRGVSEPGVE